MNDHAAARRAGRRNFLLLALLFFVPFVAAVWLYYYSAWRPSLAAHGELIDPPHHLPAIALTLPDGGTAPPGVLRGSWSLVYLGEKSCAEACTKALAELARVRLALDKDATRVQRVLLHAGDCCAPGFPGPDDQDLLVLGATGPEGEAYLALFPRAPYDTPSIYVIDPLGNLMMRHAASGSAEGLLKDLERLLRLSSIG